jgi:hypothetical protein
MPLNAASLQSSLESLFAAPPSGGGSVAGSRAACAQAWADAINGYAASIVPASTTLAAAVAALSSSLASAFAAPSAAAPFDAAFAACAVTVAAGMLPLFTGVPPPAPLGIASLLAGTQPTHAAAAAAFASLIDTWFRTGTGVLVAPPNTVVPWS